jgi:hypothetical protein
MNTFSLKNSNLTRYKLDKEQAKYISQLYSRLSKDVDKKLKNINPDKNVSSAIKQNYLHNLSKEMKQELKNISGLVENSITNNMTKMTNSVVDDNTSFLKSVGFNVEGSYSNIPTDIVASIISGNLYEGNWTLKRALWGDTQDKIKDINSIVSEGVALNKSAYEIAKDLEMYVDPKAKKPWDWNKVYPGTSKKIDYSAQRLARTMISHAYQQSLVQTTKPNPFVTGLQWLSANTERTCELCNSRNGVVYPKDQLPLDHPNGMCTFIAVISDKLENIADRIANWYNGEADPELNEFAGVLGYKSELQTITQQDKSSSYDYIQAIKSYDANEFSSRPYGYNSEYGSKIGNGVSKEEYDKNIKKWSDKTQNYIQKGDISINVNKNSLLKIIEEERFKTTYETGMTDWQLKSNNYMHYREESERTLFGVTDPKKGSPIYGYVYQGGEIRDTYGDIRIILKKENIIDRATFTFGDSMEKRTQPFMYGQELKETNFNWNTGYVSPNNKTESLQREYIETQIHGGLTTKDIYQVVLPKKHDKDIEVKLDKLGIDWRVGK